MNNASSHKITWPQVMQNNYGTPQLTFESGMGSELFTLDGKRYLDGLGGIATSIIGQAHPAVVAAVTAQIGQLSHISNLYAHPKGLELANKLLAMLDVPESAAPAIFFCNSGAEANEAAIKSARLTGRRKIVAATGGFHGRTMGALSITGQRLKQEPFLPLIGEVSFIPYGDVAALSDAIDDETSMLILEPIQGENGVITPPAGYLQSARAITRAHGALLAIDEVQTGMGRTGKWFCFQHELTAEDYPDLITMAKGLGGGLPMGALIALGAAPKFAPGQHGSTFGGNPVVASASLATISVIEGQSLMSRAEAIEQAIYSAFTDYPGVCCVRGRGALLAVVCQDYIAKEVAALAISLGLLVNAATTTAIRLAPALTITDAQLVELIMKLKEAIDLAISQIAVIQKTNSNDLGGEHE
jgi:acetylornithine aminotransferase